MQIKKKFDTRYLVRIAVAASLVSMASHSPVFAQQASDGVADQAKKEALDAWHEQIKSVDLPAEGCYHATYPSVIWEKDVCGPVPNYRSKPHWTGHHAGNGLADTAGNGDDYAAQTAKLTKAATGSFPTVKGVKSEQGTGGDGGIDGNNQYTLQLNTNLSELSASAPICATYGYSGCDTWEQYIYSTNNGSGAQVFIQNWLFISTSDYNSIGCPDSSWNAFQQTSDIIGCYKNSNAVNVTDVAAVDLVKVSLEGSAKADRLDRVTFTDGTVVHAVTEPDSTLDIATSWNQSEFNVVGNAGGSEAEFNSGSSLTVKLAVNDGNSTAPTCVANAGTTGETNNLNLGKCNTSAGSTPAIEFTESN